MSTSLKRRVFRASGWRLARLIIRPIPVVGSAVAISLAGYEIRKKGLVAGVVHVGLDITPVVGTAKGVIELFTGDLIPDRKLRQPELPLQANHLRTVATRAAATPEQKPKAGQ